MLAVLWFVIIFAIIMWLWPGLWKKGVQERVNCVVDFPRHECDIKEAVPLTVTLINRSFLPIPFAEVFINLPAELSMSPDKAVHKLRFTTYLLMRRRIQIEFTLYGCQRGPTSIRETFVRMHEGLGIRTVYVHTDQVSQIAVRPDPLVHHTNHMPITVQGDTLADNWLFKDETMFKGVRPYQPGDPARHIHWRATARLCKAMSKEFFSSTAAEVLVVLNAQTAEPHWAGTLRAPFEALCGQVVQAIVHYDKKGVEMTFATNAVIVGQRSSHVVARMGTPSIRSLLAHANAYAGESFAVLLRLFLKQRHSLPTHVVIFSTFETEEQAKLMHQLRRHGKQLELVRPALTDEQTSNRTVRGASEVQSF